MSGTQVYIQKMQVQLLWRCFHQKTFMRMHGTNYELLFYQKKNYELLHQLTFFFGTDTPANFNWLLFYIYIYVFNESKNLYTIFLFKQKLVLVIFCCKCFEYLNTDNCLWNFHETQWDKNLQENARKEINNDILIYFF